MFPRTPYMRTPPLFFALCAISQREGGHGRANTWIYTQKLYKSLIVEQNLPAGYPVFSTDSLFDSTDFFNFSTGLFFGSRPHISLYLSHLKEERRIKRASEKEMAIHGLEELLKKASTGFEPHPRVFRGFRWMSLFYESGTYALFRCDPRIH